MSDHSQFHHDIPGGSPLEGYVAEDRVFLMGSGKLGDGCQAQPVRTQRGSISHAGRGKSMALICWWETDR